MTNCTAPAKSTVSLALHQTTVTNRGVSETSSFPEFFQPPPPLFRRKPKREHSATFEDRSIRNSMGNYLKYMVSILRAIFRSWRSLAGQRLNRSKVLKNLIRERRKLIGPKIWAHIGSCFEEELHGNLSKQLIHFPVVSHVDWISVSQPVFGEALVHEHNKEWGVKSRNTGLHTHFGGTDVLRQLTRRFLIGGGRREFRNQSSEYEPSHRSYNRGQSIHALGMVSSAGFRKDRPNKQAAETMMRLMMESIDRGKFASPMRIQLAIFPSRAQRTTDPIWSRELGTPMEHKAEG